MNKINSFKNAKLEIPAIEKIQQSDLFPAESLLKSDVSVSFSNAITRAAHGLSLAEKRIIMLAVSKLDSMKPISVGESPVVRLDAIEYAQSYDLNINTAYEQLIEAGQSLFDRKITFSTPPKKEGAKQKIVTSVRWVGRYSYKPGEAWAELCFWHEIVPYLMNLNSHFTSYKFKHASKFKSIYTWRLFEMLSQYKTRWIEISITEFNHAMEVTEKMSKDFSNIRNRVILPAIRELEEKNGWIVKWEVKKIGRKVCRIRFEYLMAHENTIIKIADFKKMPINNLKGDIVL